MKETLGISRWKNSHISVDDARAYLVGKLIAAFGVTYPVHISHITGIPRAELEPIFARLESEGMIVPIKVGRKAYFIHSS